MLPEPIQNHPPYRPGEGINTIPTLEFSLADQLNDELKVLWKLLVAVIGIGVLQAVILFLTLSGHRYLQGRVLLLEQKLDAVAPEHSVVVKREKLDRD